MMIGTGTSSVSFPSRNVFTSFAPFSMSVSVSFGSASSRRNARGIQPQEDTETYIPQTLVLGMFLLIFAGHIAVNMVQVRRVRQRRVEERNANRGVNTETERAPDPPAATAAAVSLGEHEDGAEGSAAEHQSNAR